MAVPLQSDQILRIESLGDNCEPGFVLRNLGCEAGSLFRWARATPEQLLAVLRANFAGMYELAKLTPLRDEMVTDERYGIGWHTELRSRQVAGQRSFIADEGKRRKIHLKEMRKIDYLTAKFTARAKLGGVIFVIKCNDGIATATIEELITALERLAEGAPFALLEISQSADPLKIGTVEQKRPGWLRGYVSRFAPYDHADDVDMAAWATILDHAFRLFPCPDWAARLSRLAVGEARLELGFPLDKKLDFAKPLLGDRRAGAATLHNGNSWCRRVDDMFRLHGGEPGSAGTILRWTGVYVPGTSRLSATLECPVEDSLRVEVTATVCAANGARLGAWRGSVAPSEPEEIDLHFTAPEPGPLTIEVIVHASRQLQSGERAVIDLSPPALYPATAAEPLIEEEGLVPVGA
jgi:hypothetical protein